MSDSSLQVVVVLLGVVCFLVAGLILLMGARRSSNVILSAFLLVFGIQSLGAAGMTGAKTVTEATPWSFVFTLGLFQNGTGLLLLALNLFRPHWMRRAYVSLPLTVLIVVPWLLLLSDVLFHTQLIYSGLNPAVYAGGYVEPVAYLDTPLARLLRGVNIIGIHLVIIAFLIYLLTRRDIRSMRSALVILFVVEMFGLVTQVILRGHISSLAAFVLVQAGLVGAVIIATAQTRMLAGPSLSYSQKFILIGLLFALPLAAFYPLVSEQATRADQYGWKELYGTLYLRPARHLLEDVLKHYIAAHELNEGHDVRAELEAAQSRVDQDFQTLQSAQQQYRTALQLGPEVDDLSAQWQALKSDMATLEMGDIRARHDQLIADIRALISRVGDTSYLILDPDLDTYYLMDAVLLKLPESQTTIVETMHFADRLVHRGILMSDEKAQLVGWTRLIQANRSALSANVTTALRNNATGNLRLIVEAPLQANLDATQQFLDMIQTRVLDPDVVTIEPEDFVALGENSLAANFAFYDAASQALEVGVKARIDRFTSQLVFVGVAGTIGIVIAFAVGLSVMRGISRPLSQLTAATRRLAQGDMSAQVAVTTTDEVGQVSAAFNDMVQRLQAARVALEARATQARASVEVGRVVTSILDPDQLLNEVVNKITDRFGFYYAAIFTLDERGQFAVLREATGEAGRLLKERGHRLEVGGQSMVGYVTAWRKPRIALDVGEESVRFVNPLLPDTRSEIALPLVVGDQVLGALDVQSTQVNAFDEDSLATLQAMADQVAVALANAQSFGSVQTALQAATRLYELGRALFAATAPREAYAAVAREQTALPGLDRLSIFHVASRDTDGEPIEYVLAAEWDAVDGARLEPDARRRALGQLPLVSLVDREAVVVVRDADQPHVTVPTRRILAQAGWTAAILVPLIIQGQYEGFVAGVARQAQNFSSNDVRYLQSTAEQLAVVLNSLRASEETRAALERVALLNQRLSGEAWQHYLATRPDLTAESGRATETPNANRLSAPIVVRGQTLGVLDLEPADPARQWSDEEWDLVNTISGEVALAIENARLIEQTQLRVARETQLNAITERIRRAANVESILRVATEELSRVLDTSHANARLGSPKSLAGRPPNGKKHT